VTSRQSWNNRDFCRVPWLAVHGFLLALQAKVGDKAAQKKNVSAIPRR
jgi:hypothetical protein